MENKRPEISFEEFYAQSREIIKNISDVLVEDNYHMVSVCYALSWSLSCASQDSDLTKEQAIESFKRVFESVLEQKRRTQ
jgi:hypothetical protein